MQATTLSASKHQLSSAFIGLATIFVVGLGGCVAIILASLWLILQISLIVIQASIETLNTIGLLYSTADPLIKFCLLVFLAYGIYRIVKGRKNG